MNRARELDQAIGDYLLWMIDRGYSKSTWSFYERILVRFRKYVDNTSLSPEDVFSKTTLADFGRQCRLVQFEPPIRGLVRYLYNNGTITRSLDKKDILLPEIYLQYLDYYQKTRQVCKLQVLNTRRVFVLFSDWLAQEKIELSDLEIEHADRFQSEISNSYAPDTGQRHRSVLRGLFGWLHQQRIIRRDLAPLLVGAPQYARAIPPRFLRPDELKKLLARQPLTANEKRTWAMLQLACFLGMRPKEISLIRLEDISFSQQEILLPERKGANPISVPLPMTAVKAIAEYIIDIRPESKRRELFLQLQAPYGSVTGQRVGKSITDWMRMCGVPGSAYHLRHTYALNLLTAGASVFAVKEMLGHDRIQTTGRYLSIRTEMMREVLFNETI